MTNYNNLICPDCMESNYHISTMIEVRHKYKNGKKIGIDRVTTTRINGEKRAITSERRFECMNCHEVNDILTAIEFTNKFNKEHKV